MMEYSLITAHNYDVAEILKPKEKQNGLFVYLFLGWRLSKNVKNF